MRVNDDVLASSKRAWRVATAAPSDGAATRARVLDRIETARVRRTFLRQVGVTGLVLVAILTVGSAAWTAIGHWGGRAPAPARPEGSKQEQNTHSIRRTPSAEVQAPASVASVPSLAIAEPQTGSPPADPLPAPLRSAVAAGPDAEPRAYERAHQAHFTGDDPARALQEWNRYLAAFPRGAFAPEAQYNRALCLVRLGRWDAAARALRPFADGKYQGYRRVEAQSVLDWLARRTSSDSSDSSDAPAPAP